MFIAAKRSVSRPPSGGPCQPTMCERGNIKQWPSDVGRERFATASTWPS
jgi:hypothetical protein